MFFNLNIITYSTFTLFKNKEHVRKNGYFSNFHLIIDYRLISEKELTSKIDYVSEIVRQKTQSNNQ